MDPIFLIRNLLSIIKQLYFRLYLIVNYLIKDQFVYEFYIRCHKQELWNTSDQMTQINKSEHWKLDQKLLVSQIFLQKLPQTSFKENLVIFLIEKIKQKLSLTNKCELSYNQLYEEQYQNSIKYLCYDLIQMVDILESELDVKQESAQAAHYNDRKVESNNQKYVIQMNTSGKKSLKSDQQYLLDDLNSKHTPINFIPQNQISEIQTIKKVRPFSLEQPRITPLKTFNQLAKKRSSQIYELNNKNDEDNYFDQKIINLKQEINLLKSIISINGTEEIQQSRISTSQVFSYNIKSIEVDQSKQSQQHLINQNIELRAIIKELKNALSQFVPSLLEIKADLTQCLKLQLFD